MIHKPDLPRWLLTGIYDKLYAIGQDAPELRTVPDQDFVDPQEFLRMLKEDIFLATFEGDQPVGFVHAVLWKRHGCISYLVVQEEFRKRGHGKELLARVIDELKRQGAVNLYAWARHGSDVNHLVDKFGFHRGGNFTYVFHPLGGSE